jgi:hypothetical protein
MSDGITDSWKEQERAKIVEQSLWEIANQMWYYAKQRPEGELRESFITDMLENVSNSLIGKMKEIECYSTRIIR